MKVNLSQLHKLIKRKNEELKKVYSDISNIKSITVTSNMSELQFLNFLSEVEAEKENYIDKFNNISFIVREIADLKNALNSKNIEHGIDKLMLESSFYMKEIDTKKMFLKFFYTNQHAKFTQNDVSLEDLKASLSETEKVFLYEKRVLSNDDVKFLEDDVENIKNLKNEVDDKIAMLNQTIFVEI